MWTARGLRGASGDSSPAARQGNRLGFVEDLRQFAAELPAEQVPVLLGFLQARCWRDVLADRSDPFPPPAPVDETPPLSTKQAARALGCSPWEVLARVRRGVLVGEQNARNGRWKFERAEIARYKREHSRGGFAAGIDPRYSSPHAETPGTSPAHPHPASARGARHSGRPRVDATAARERPRGDVDDGRPVGARRPCRDAPRRDEPYAPGAAAWSGPAPPPPRDEPPES